VDTSEKRDTAQRRCVIAQRKRYTKQFKEEALQLVSQEGVSLNQVAQDLGLDASMFRGQGLARDEELAKLKCELGRVKRERDFLKDAAAYFAKESKRGFGV
jgi:transposase